MSVHTARRDHQHFCTWKDCPRPQIKTGDRYSIIQVPAGTERAFGSNYRGMQKAKFHAECLRAFRAQTALETSTEWLALRQANFDKAVARAREALA